MNSMVHSLVPMDENAHANYNTQQWIMDLLLRLKLSQLKPLSILLGSCKSLIFQRVCLIIHLASVGTKSQLVDNLLRASNEGAKKSPFSVLSVDMGVRNLAFCQLQIPKVGSQVQVSNWARLDIEKEFRPASWPESLSSFDPERLAQITYDLVQSKFLNAATRKLPDVVLIERQRFRSGSSAAILEWTVRVNMLENMLHAILYANSQQGGIGNCNIYGIQPKRVLNYWRQEVDQDRIQVADRSDSNYKETKELKTQIAVSLIQNPKRFDFSSDSSAARDQLLGGKGKNDDIADAFLQGLAWTEWQKNREILRDILEPNSHLNLSPDDLLATLSQAFHH